MVDTDLSDNPISQNLGPRGIRLADLPDDERPREKAVRFGMSALTTAELLSILLRTGMVGVPITTIMKELMYAHDNRLHNLGRTLGKQLCKFKGIGEVKAQQIEALFELIKRYNEEESANNIIIRCSDDIYNLMRPSISNLDHEEIWMIMLNRRNEAFERLRITSGTSTQSVFDVKMILKRALLANAEGIILCHNHPSGNTAPSSADDNITRKLYLAAQTVGLTMLDHVIVCTHDFYSYRDQGKIIGS